VSEIRYGVPEPIYVDDFRSDRLFTELRFQRWQFDKFANFQFGTKFFKWNAPCDVGSHRSENIATVKGSADGWQEVIRILKFNALDNFALTDSPPKQSIVWTGEKVFSGLNGDCPPTCPYPRVNDGAKNCAFREKLERSPQRQRTCIYILRRDFVSQISDLSVRTNSPNHAFHHANINVLSAKIREQCNDPHVTFSPSRYSKSVAHERRLKNLMKELIALLVFLAVWVFLQAYLLPKLGVPT
jgi:hypothetical protein